MNIKTNKLGLISLITVSGPITKPNLELLKENLENHLTSGDLRILVDLKDAPLIDSAGLELLWDSLMAFRKVGGSIKLVNANTLMMDIFIATKMTNIFEIFSENEKAMRSFL